MNDEARRKILEKVAAGQMDPGDAADALAALDRATPDDAPGEPASAAESAPPADAATERVVGRRVRVVRVDANFRPVEIVGDEGVQEAVAEGTHRIRWEGDTLVIDGATGFDDDEGWDDDDSHDFGEWFRTRGPRMARSVRFSGQSPAEYRPKPLRVRMNPDVELDARVEAGPLRIVRVKAPIKARVAAGPLKIEGFESPLDVRVAAGKVDATGRIDHGDSTIDCDAGKVRLHLTHGSHARVSASATLGKVDFGGRKGKTKRDYFEDVRAHGIRGDLGDLSALGDRISSILNNAFSDEHEVVVGRGTATVDIRVSMGAADITFDDSAGS
ncbi:MAG TPA: hypothetical protein VHC63_18375 [Acidimicrobiales bacterium]|nr:hypothetical protein [Acidimicrobiales bacterium]